MMMYNKLTPAQSERLYLLLEELGEAQQAIGKILRHGYEETHPDGGPTNRESLERELGDVIAAMNLLIEESSDLRSTNIREAAENKLEKVRQYLHHHTNEGPL